MSSPGAKLDDLGALAAAYALYPALFEVVEADLADDPEALEAALGAAKGTPAGPGFTQPLTVLEGMAWIFDDDGVHGPTEPDPLFEAMGAQLGYQSVERVHAQVHLRIEPIAERLGWYGLFDRLTHVVSSGAVLHGSAPAGLRSVRGPISDVREWLSETLEAVTLVRSVELGPLLELPQLSHLGLWYAEPAAVLEALRHPVVRRLEVLDLFDVDSRAFPYAEVLAHRDALVHLRRLCLPTPAFSPGARAAFSDWPAVRFASHDRRALLGQDLRVLGFPAVEP